MLANTQQSSIVENIDYSEYQNLLNQITSVNLEEISNLESPIIESDPFRSMILDFSESMEEQVNE